MHLLTDILDLSPKPEVKDDLIGCDITAFVKEIYGNGDCDKDEDKWGISRMSIIATYRRSLRPSRPLLQRSLQSTSDHPRQSHR